MFLPVLDPNSKEKIPDLFVIKIIIPQGRNDLLYFTSNNYMVTKVKNIFFCLKF